MLSGHARTRLTTARSATRRTGGGDGDRSALAGFDGAHRSHHCLNFTKRNAATPYARKPTGGASIAIAILAPRGISLRSAESVPAAAAPPHSPPSAPPTNINNRGRYAQTTQNAGSGGMTSISWPANKILGVNKSNPTLIFNSSDDPSGSGTNMTPFDLLRGTPSFKILGPVRNPPERRLKFRSECPGNVNGKSILVCSWCAHRWLNAPQAQRRRSVMRGSVHFGGAWCRS